MAGRKKEIPIEEALGVTHISQSLLILPRKLLDLRNPITNLAAMNRDSGKQVLTLTLKDKIYYSGSGKQLVNSNNGIPIGKPARVRLTFVDAKGQFINSTCFQPFQFYQIPNNQTMTIMAEYGEYNGRSTLENVEIVPDALVGKLAPIYPAIRGKASADAVFAATRDALDNHLDTAAEYFVGHAGMRPDDIEKLVNADAIGLLLGIHDPLTPDEFEKALAAAKKIAIHEIQLKADRMKNRPPEKRSMLLTSPITFNGITPTDDQARALEETLTDIRSGFAMRRLLSGDVGRGKTLPMIGAAASVWRAQREAGKDVNIAIILPNEGLVNQVMAQMEHHFPDVVTSPITGSRKKSWEKGAVLIGTSAIAHLKEYKADLLIVDEQQKFSREQREAVTEDHTNLLEATATAIPRTIALIQRGGMDVSILRQSPVVKEIDTYLVGADDRFAIYDDIKTEVEAGNRVLIVYPLVDAGDKDEPQDFPTVEEGYQAWGLMFGDKVGMVHGQMTADEKADAIAKMRSLETQVLVASSVVEVGLDIPDVTIMMVVDPQRYGMNQIHQMRGRLVRNGGKGNCYLFPTQAVGEDAMKRLEGLVETNDGFEIAERDLQLRGFGDLSIDSEEQNGAANVTFRGLKIMPQDFDPAPEPTISRGPRP
ncbi:helicase-related protein [Methylobacillus sp. Pita2]|uniref:helicase-related protein n=1 Tax=Methylobacillus sp. Pita2 TaxID=3383245 RepID=UPI0038B6058B